MRLIFRWINVRVFKFVSAKFVLFFYPPKSTLVKFLSKLVCCTGSVLKRKILHFNNLNWELYWLMWYIFSNFVENCSFSSINIMGIKITYFVTSKISPHKIIEISPPTKISPREKWHTNADLKISPYIQIHIIT